MKEIAFTVPGIPRPGGSKKAFTNKRTGRAMIVETGTHTKAWRETVATFAWQKMRELKEEPLTGPLEMTITFYMPRPKAHYRTNGDLKPNAPKCHTSKPDTTKLIRPTEDAMTGIVYRDDSQIVIQSASKIYTTNACAQITIREIEV